MFYSTIISQCYSSEVILVLVYQTFTLKIEYWRLWSLPVFYIDRDLNPLHNVIIEREYRDKYYKSLIPLGVKYAEVSTINRTGTYTAHVDFIVISNSFLRYMAWWLNTAFMQLLPWGGKLTSESLKFFSPIVIWTRFTSSSNNYEILYSAFMDYYKVQCQRFLWVLLFVIVLMMPLIGI